MMMKLATIAGYRNIKAFAVMALVLGATLVVAVGRGLITASLAASTYKYIGWGTGAGTAADGDTTLFTEVTDTARATGTQSQQTTTTTNDTYRVVGTITATTARAITNAGVFDALTTGNLFSKGDFTTINLSTGDSIQFTFNHKLS